MSSIVQKNKYIIGYFVIIFYVPDEQNSSNINDWEFSKNC